jgi:hypothetical protein
MTQFALGVMVAYFSVMVMLLILDVVNSRRRK